MLTNTDEIIETQLTPYQTNVLAFVSNQLNRISLKARWRVLCYEKALVVLLVARLINVNINLYFGLQRDTYNNLLAHAWTRVNDYYVTGGENAHLFTTTYVRGLRIKKHYLL